MHASHSQLHPSWLGHHRVQQAVGLRADFGSVIPKIPALVGSAALFGAIAARHFRAGAV